jgi:hypothetical protein
MFLMFGRNPLAPEENRPTRRNVIPPNQKTQRPKMPTTTDKLQFGLSNLAKTVWNHISLNDPTTQTDLLTMTPGKIDWQKLIALVKQYGPVILEIIEQLLSQSNTTT